MLLTYWVLFTCVLVWSSVAQDIIVNDLSFDTVATGTFQFDLPRLLGPDGDILSSSVNAGTLQYGSIKRVLDWTYEYATNYTRVDPNGCIDLASYTLTDGKGFSATAAITIQIGKPSSGCRDCFACWHQLMA
jgi:hypothetical protein